MIAVLLCSLLRGARLQESRVQAMALLTEIAAGCDDDTRLQRMVPYLMVSSSASGCPPATSSHLEGRPVSLEALRCLTPNGHCRVLSKGVHT